jgi:hypothetical protein
VKQSSFNRQLTQFVGILIGMGIALFILRGLRIITFLPGGVIGLLFLGAIAIGVLSYLQTKWWRF